MFLHVIYVPKSLKGHSIKLGDLKELEIKKIGAAEAKIS